MARTFIALVPPEWDKVANLPVATATTRREAREEGAKWCNANLSTGKIKVVPSEIPLMEVRPDTKALIFIQAPILKQVLKQAN